MSGQYCVWLRVITVWRQLYSAGLTLSKTAELKIKEQKLSKRALGTHALPFQTNVKCIGGITEQFLNSLLSDVSIKIQLSGSKIEICSLGVVTVPKIRHSGSVGVAVQPRCGSPLITGMTQLLTWISQVQM